MTVKMMMMMVMINSMITMTASIEIARGKSYRA